MYAAVRSSDRTFMEVPSLMMWCRSRNRYTLSAVSKRRTRYMGPPNSWKGCTSCGRMSFSFPSVSFSTATPTGSSGS